MIPENAAGIADDVQSPNISNRFAAAMSIVAGLIFYFSNPNPHFYYNYTYLVAGRLLDGAVGLTEQPPPWLNEFVPFDGYFYSVFPLGSVLTMVPAALLRKLGAINEMPAAMLAAICAAVSCWFFLLIACRYPISRMRAIVMTLVFLFGTFTWTNLTMAGAWQLALGFAMAGLLGAIYFTVYDKRPLIAGLFFALAFGNRTEILLTAPILMLLLVRTNLADGADHAARTLVERFPPKRVFVSIALFCVVPFLLGVSTLVYNEARFGSFTDFGYARIPGVLDEPWYSHGIFSYRYIPGQMWEMFLKPWIALPVFPYLKPNEFSSSILWSSPFILFALRSGARDRLRKCLAWAAILLLCIVLWMHGNSGGWQFGYRYAMVCLPWLFVILLESSPRRLGSLESTAIVVSFMINAYATWLFHWTDYIPR